MKKGDIIRVRLHRNQIAEAKVVKVVETHPPLPPERFVVINSLYIKYGGNGPAVIPHSYVVIDTVTGCVTNTEPHRVTPKAAEKVFWEEVLESGGVERFNERLSQSLKQFGGVFSTPEPDYFWKDVMYE